MEVHKHDLRLGIFQYGVDGQERVVRVGVEREAADKVDDQHLARFGVEADAAASRALRGVVGRAYDAHLVVQVGLDLPARPGVVAERDAVGAGVEYGVHLPRRAADDICVFAVDDHKVRFQLTAYGAQPALYIFKARRADSVAHR